VSEIFCPLGNVLQRAQWAESPKKQSVEVYR